jgi:hypothetical protein
MGWRERNRPPSPEAIFWGYRADGTPLLLRPYVPWQGSRTNGNCFRRIRTAQERRAWDPRYGRPGRSPAQLPEYHDEMMRHVERCWKRHRRRQYHVR